MKKKIIFLNGHMKTGGVEKSLLDILRHFDYEKYDVDLLLLEEGDDYLSEIPEHVNLIHKPLTSTYGAFLSSIRNCIKKRDYICLVIRICILLSKWTKRSYNLIARVLLGKKKYDCAIAFRIGICGDLTAYGIWAKKKFLWWHHGEVSLNQSQIAHQMQVFKEMDKIIAVSESCREEFLKSFPIDEKVSVLSNMIDAAQIRFKAAMHNPYASQPNIIHIVSVSRIAPEKHFENVVYATEILLSKGLNKFIWHVVGGDYDYEKICDMVVQHNLTDYIHMEGSQPNPYPYMKYADLFVHPSYVESQGLVVLEAMTLGVPCVVTRSLGPCEFIEDGVNGILTEQSAESLAEKVNDILNDHNELKNIRNKTCCPIRFSPINIISQIESLIES